MKRRFLTLSLMLLAYAGLHAEPTFYDGVAAYVNDKVITVDTVMQELHNGFDLSSVPPAEQANRIRELFPVVRDMLVNRTLILEAYIVVSPKKIKEYYAAHAADFAEGAGTHVRSITVDPAGGVAAAEKALAELKAGKPFAEVAKAYSSDPQAAQGGDWGFVNPATSFAAPIVEALSKLKPGETSGIIEMGEWRAIVQKVAERAGDPPSLAEAWPKVEAAVRAELGQTRYNEWVENLRKNAYIKNVDVKL